MPKPELFLLVDDSHDFVVSMRRNLARAGVDVVVAHSVAGALLAIKENSAAVGPAARPFAGAFIDLRLPDGNGSTIVDDLRRREPPIPTLVVTSDGDNDAARRAYRLGASVTIKPFTWDDIVLFIERAKRERAEHEQQARTPEQLAKALGARCELTDREMELLLAALVVPRAELADHLGITEATTRAHIGRILDKTGTPRLSTLVAGILNEARGVVVEGRDREASDTAEERRR